MGVYPITIYSTTSFPVAIYYLLMFSSYRASFASSFFLSGIYSTPPPHHHMLLLLITSMQSSCAFPGYAFLCWPLYFFLPLVHPLCLKEKEKHLLSFLAAGPLHLLSSRNNVPLPYLCQGYCFVSTSAVLTVGKRLKRKGKDFHSQLFCTFYRLVEQQ